MSLKDFLPDFTSENIQFDPANAHCTFSQSRTNTGVVTTFSVIGFADPIFALREKYPKHSQHEKYGTLDDLTITQSEGPHWIATFTYSKEVADDDSESGTGTLTGPKSSQLTVRMISYPIERAKNYRYNWNYNLLINKSWYDYRRKNLLNQTYWKIDGEMEDYNIEQLIDYIWKHDGEIYTKDGTKYHKNLIKAFGLQPYVKWEDSAGGRGGLSIGKTNYKAGITSSRVRENNDGSGTYEFSFSNPCWVCYDVKTKPRSNFIQLPRL